MTKLRRRNTYIAFIVVGVLAILGITLASAFRVSKSTDVNVYPVTLEANIDLIENLQDVVSGDTIVNGVSFSRATDSNDIYVRADLRYEATGTLSDEDKRFLLAINYDDVATHEDTSYKWVRAEDGYYYLTDLSGAPLKVTNSDDYIFCSGLTYQGAKCINNDAPAPATLKLNAEIQAIHAKDMDSVTLTDLSTLFNTYFGAPASLGYIVAFDTDDAGLVKAQTFLSSGLTVTEPPEPTKLGYDFAGWYTDPEFTNEYNFEIIVTKSFTLYAKFELPTIEIIENGIVLNKIHNNNYTLRELILSTSELQNTYNFYNDQLLSDNITLDDVLADDHKIYVEPVTAGLNYNKITNSDACRVGDDSLTSGNAMTSAVTDTDIVIADNYTLDGKIVYPVTEIGQYAFRFKSTLTSVKMPNTITSIGTYAFDTCSSLTSITIGRGITKIDTNAFHDCYQLVQVINNSNLTLTKASKDSGMVAYYAIEVANVGEITTGEFIDNDKYHIFSFDNTEYLVGLKVIGVTTINDLSNIDVINQYAFYSRPIKSITIPYSVKSIGTCAFRYCTDLASMTIPYSVTNIGSYAFGNCTKLASVTIEYATTGTGGSLGVSTIGNSAFVGCTSLTRITIPNSVINIGDGAFSGCSSLNNVNIGSGVTKIEASTFSFCSALTSIIIPNNVTSIGRLAFYMCSKLNSVVLGSGVITIGDSVFGGCTRLYCVMIPASVTSIGSGTFISCDYAYLLCETEAVRTLATDKGISDASRILVKVTDSAINSALESRSWSAVNTIVASTTYDGVTYYRGTRLAEYYCQ